MKTDNINYLKSSIRIISDYPIKGVSFKDISPLLADTKAMKIAAESLNAALEDRIISSVMAIEARGFVFGSILALEKNASFIMIRKAAKLPPVETNIYFESKSEYSKEKLGFNSSYLREGKILVHDDVLATGGTVKSVIEALMDQCGISSSRIFLSFLVELSFLKGRDNLVRDGLIPEANISSLLLY